MDEMEVREQDEQKREIQSPSCVLFFPSSLSLFAISSYSLSLSRCFYPMTPHIQGSCILIAI